MPDQARESLILLPEVEVRRRLTDRALALRLVLPPFPALGVGELRVLRIDEADVAIELYAGYERYERLESR